jgi:GT2 family glycosyltransferase
MNSEISAIVTAYERVEQAIATIRAILACVPTPKEIIVHVDANQKDCEDEIRRAFPGILTIRTQDRIGPGGGRNKLIEAATTEYVASFDDDSYPIDADYFARSISLLEKFPEASIICATLYHRGDAIATDSRSAEWSADFAGGACIYRRSAFLKTGGYVPLAIAYSMEESDLALRVHANGGRILRTKWLRVFHDTDLKRHADPVVTASSIANLALLAYLRYPVTLWTVGIAQCMNRVIWLMAHGRWRGIWAGLTMIPSHLRAHQKYRRRLSYDCIKSYRSLRRTPLAESLQ